MIDYLWGFFVPLGAIVVLIFLLNQLQYRTDLGISKEAGDIKNKQDTADENTDDIGQLRHGLVADAIHAYRKHRESDEQVRAKRDQINVNISVFTAVFAFAAAGAAIYSAWIFSGQLKEMRVASVDVQRAFVAVTELAIKRGNPNRFMNGVPESRFWMLTPQVENSGTTPTRNLRWIVAPGFTFATEEDIPKVAADVEAQTPDLNRAWNYGVLGPRAHMSLDYAGNASGLLDTAASGLAVGIVKMLFQGVLRYNDIFADTDEHVTKFCYWIRVDFSNSEKTAVGDPYARQCGGYTNCTDNECRRSDHR
jgi:hypothetical protein